MRYKAVIGICLLFTGISCNKMLDIPSHRALTEENMWQNKNDARAGLAACYALMRAAILNENAHWVYGELRGNDFHVTRRGDLQATMDNNLNANFRTMDEWRDWRRFYAAIAQCNLTIERLPEVTKRDFRYSANDLKLDISQALYIRAFLYYYIVRIWGDVPLVTSAADGTDKVIAREDWRKVLDFAAAQAEAAIEGVPWKYNGQSPEQQGQYRGQSESHHISIFVTKGMCYTLLAHIHAWKEDYAQALKYANIVIDNQSQTGYGIASVDEIVRVDGAFRGRSGSNIFQIDMNFDHAEISTTGQLEDWTLREPDIPKRESEIYVPKDSIYNIYNEANDQRMRYFNKLDEAYPVFYKMKQLNSAVKDPTLKLYSSCIIIFRYEELYLLRAECKERLGMTDAANDLNTLRSQRSLKSVNGRLVTGQAMLDTIFRERRRELMGEAWYWYDLVHFKKIPQYTNVTADEVARGAALWPISQNVLTNNQAIIQNSFWK